MDQSIEIWQLKELLKTKQLHLIDIREHYMYERGTISNAINIPYRILKDMPDKYLDLNNLYYIFCESGMVSLKLCTYLNSLGYQTISVKDGYEGFINL